MSKRKKNRRAPARPAIASQSQAELQSAVAAGLIALIVYIVTLYPSIGGGDSGGLVSAAATWGVAHPPGYPLWTVIGKIFTWIPLRSIAWRVNLFSGICDALATGLIAASVYRLTRSRASAFLSAGLFAFSPLIWHYAVRAEVFSLNNLFVALLLYRLIRFNETRGFSDALKTAFVCGLGLSHHHTFLFFAAPSFLFIVFQVGFRRLLPLAAVAALGLLPYVYLPLASSADPFASWGATNTLDGFLNHFFRRDYGTFQLWARNSSDSLFLKTLGAYFRSLLEQTLYVGPVLAFLGVRSYWRASEHRDLRSWLRLSVFLYLFYVIVFQYLSQSDPSKELEYEILSRFWQQPNIIVALWIGLGSAALARRFETDSGWPRRIPATVAAGLVLLQLGVNFQKQDARENTAVADYGHALYGSLPPNSLLLSLGDLNTYSSLYLHECEHFRDDVRIVDRMLLGYSWDKRLVQKRYPDVVLPGEKLYGATGYSTLQLIDANYDRFPVYAAELKEYDREAEVKQKYRFWKTGFLYRVIRNSEPLDLPRINELFRENETVFASLEPRPRPSDHFWEKTVWRDYWNARYLSAFEFFRFGQEEKDKNSSGPEWSQSLRDAILIWKDILKRHPAPEPFTHKNIGIAYKMLTPVDPAAREQAIAHFRAFLKITPKTSPEYVPAVNDLRSLGATP